MENGQDHIQKCLCSWWTEAQWWEVVRTTAGTSSSGSGSRDVLFPLLLHLELSVGGEVFCCQVLKLKSPLTNALAIRALLALLARYLFSLSLISTVTCVITNSLCDILYYCCITWVKCIACITCITGITWRQRAEWHIAVLYFFVISIWGCRLQTVLWRPKLTKLSAVFGKSYLLKWIPGWNMKKMAPKNHLGFKKVCFSGFHKVLKMIDGHQCQLDNECRGPMNNDKDCWFEQLTRGWGGWRVVTEAEGGLRGLRGAEGGSGVRGVKNLVTFQKIKGWMGPLMVYMACISVYEWSRFFLRTD